MKKSNRSNIRYTHEGKTYSSYKAFMKAVRKSEHDAHNWKMTTGYFSGILLKPFGSHRLKQFAKAEQWRSAHYDQLEAERSRARWSGELC